MGASVREAVDQAETCTNFFFQQPDYRYRTQGKKGGHFLSIRNGPNQENVWSDQVVPTSVSKYCIPLAPTYEARIGTYFVDYGIEGYWTALKPDNSTSRLLHLGRDTPSSSCRLLLHDTVQRHSSTEALTRDHGGEAISSSCLFHGHVGPDSAPRSLTLRWFCSAIRFCSGRWTSRKASRSRRPSKPVTLPVLPRLVVTG